MSETASPLRSQVARPQASRPLVIAHRGAPGYRPEHTLASYRLAIELGADYIEPDLVSTRDGVLVARHENQIGGTTDVAERREFARRQTTRVVDGREVIGWFTEDFTLAELKTLRAVERLPEVRPANTWYDAHFEIPTFDEILDLAEWGSRRRGVTIGVYPETKHSTYFASLGLPLEEPLVAALRRHHLDRPNAPVLVQSFETGNLRRLAEMVSVPLVQLVAATGAPYDWQEAGGERESVDLLGPSGLREVATYAAAVGVDHTLLTPGGRSVVDAAHHEGLAVHAWTLRNENRFLPEGFRFGDDPVGHGRATAYVESLLDLGVDGVFSDQPDTVVEARRGWLERHRDCAGSEVARP